MTVTVEQQTIAQMDSEMMAPEGKKEVDKAIDITNGLLKLGTFAFPQIKTAVEIFAAVGALVKLFTTAEEKPDPVLEKLKDLEKKIDQLVEQMNTSFADLKAFITEINFHDKVILPTSILTRYLRDVLNRPGKESYDRFNNAYLKSKPLDLAYTVMGLMDQEVTNPLKMAMNAESLKTKSTFKKWDDIISGVIAEFLFIESFASGLFNEGSMYDIDRMIEEAEKQFGKIGKLKQGYEKDEGYWPALEKYMSDFADKTGKMKDSEKADKVKEVLDDLLTTDAFYVIVANERGFYSKEESRLIIASNFTVYRSKTANSVDPKIYSRFKEQVGYMNGAQIDLSNGFQFDFLIKYIFDANFSCYIEKGKAMEIRSANCNLKDGPGIQKEIEIITHAFIVTTRRVNVALFGLY